MKFTVDIGIFFIYKSHMFSILEKICRPRHTVESVVREIVNLPPKPPASIEDAYWEHPSHDETRSGYGKVTKHPHKLTVWHCNEDGSHSVGSPRTFWPFTGEMWCFGFNYDTDYRGDNGCDPKKMNEFDRIKEWCLENCQGRWVWSREVSQWFCEMGSARSVGWHTHRSHYLLIESDEDAVHFRMTFDKSSNVSGYKTKEEVIEQVKRDNKEAGWKKYEIEFGS